MKKEKHIEFSRHPERYRFKKWLDNNALKVLSEVGIVEGDNILDFGSGTGTYTIPAAKLVGVYGRVYALDVNQKDLKELENRSKKAGLDNIFKLISSGNSKISLPDRVLDHVLLIDVLHDISDKIGLLNEVNRILKPGGIVTIYPMHIQVEDVVNIASVSNLKLKEKKFQERLLLFKK